MNKKPLPLFKTQHFEDRFNEAIDYYLRSGGLTVAEDLIDSIEKAFQRISDNPMAGMLYLPPAEFEEIAKLRYRMLHLNAFSPFPLTIYYVIKRDRIIIQTLMHNSQDRDSKLLANREKDTDV